MLWPPSRRRAAGVLDHVNVISQTAGSPVLRPIWMMLECRDVKMNPFEAGMVSSRQVLIRPDLLDLFGDERLQSVISAGDTSLQSTNGTSNAGLASDHLPLAFKLNLEKERLKWPQKTSGAICRKQQTR
jgi:hypothetical protein